MQKASVSFVLRFIVWVAGLFSAVGSWPCWKARLRPRDDPARKKKKKGGEPQIGIDHQQQRRPEEAQPTATLDKSGRSIACCKAAASRMTPVVACNRTSVILGDRALHQEFAGS